MCRCQWYAAHLRLIFHSWMQPEKRVEKRNAELCACDERLTQIVLSTFHHNICARCACPTLSRRFVSFVGRRVLLYCVHLAEQCHFPLFVWEHSGAVDVFQFSIISPWTSATCRWHCESSSAAANESVDCGLCSRPVFCVWQIGRSNFSFLKSTKYSSISGIGGACDTDNTVKSKGNKKNIHIRCKIVAHTVHSSDSDETRKSELRVETWTKGE